ncbi:MAG: hypothetical protein JRI41_10210 [Deltaproteobacteria bacterium]|nr:hypothetical protein [Deltaproteobacteria bacterium]
MENINKDLGFELCRMDGVAAIVQESFIKAGEQFATDVKVLDIEPKRILKTASSRGVWVGSILEKQIDGLGREISRGVDLSERKIEVTQKPISEVTTDSMEALNYFIRGRTEYEKFLEIWKDADEDLPEWIDAKVRLVNLVCGID